MSNQHTKFTANLIEMIEAYLTIRILNSSCCCSCCTCTLQKPSHGKISETKRGIIDQLVSKRPKKLYKRILENLKKIYQQDNKKINKNNKN